MVKKRLGWLLNGLNFEWDLKSESPTIWNLDKWQPFCQKSFEIQTKTSRFRTVGILAIAIAKAPQFENQTIWNPAVKKPRFQMFPDFKWLDFRSPLYFWMLPQLIKNIDGVTRNATRLVPSFGNKIWKLLKIPFDDFIETFVDGVASVRVKVVTVQVKRVSLKSDWFLSNNWEKPKLYTKLFI